MEKSSSLYQRKINPRKNAGVFSIITFFFTRDIFIKGVKSGINEFDIYEQLESYESSQLTERLQNEWEIKKKKINKYRMVSCLFKLFGCQFIIYGIVVFLVKTLLMIAKPLLIGKIVSYFDVNKRDKMTREEALQYALLFLLCNFLSTLFMQNQHFYIHQFALKMKVAIGGLIYRKLLRLNSETASKLGNGKVITLLTKDILSFDYSPMFIHDLWIGVIHVGIMTYIIFLQIGVSCFVGVGFLFVLLPVHGFLAKAASKMRLKTAMKTDTRLRITQDLLNAIKIVKMNAMEFFFQTKLTNFRREEVRKLKLLFYIKFFAIMIGIFCAKIAICLCILVYAALGNRITPEKAFVVLTSFGTLRMTFAIIFPMGFSSIAEMFVSIKRITDFLYSDEISLKPIETTDKSRSKIIVEKLTVNENEQKTILDNFDATFTSGLNVVTGPTGSGKSLFLKVLINEIKPTSGSVKNFGKISYASQDPWLFPGTIKENIVFYNTFDENRYTEVLRICALRKDINALPRKDYTFVIDKGLNLSIGQQARISLARAIYQEADIYLFDDVLSSIDSHVSKYIFEECFQKFLKDKLCILVTHNPQHIKQCDNLFVISNSKLESYGPYKDISNDILSKMSPNLTQSDIDKTDSEKTCRKMKEHENDDGFEENTLLNKDDDDILTNDKILKMYQEYQSRDQVPWSVYKKYFLFGGGYIIISIIGVLHIASQLTNSWSDTFIREWVNLEPRLGNLELKNLTYTKEYSELSYKHNYLLVEYISLLVAAIALSVILLLIYFSYNEKLGFNLHNSVIAKILAAPMKFFDLNLSRNIQNKFSRDLTIVDEIIPFLLKDNIRLVLNLCGTIVVISTVNWMLLLPSLVLLVILYFMRILYLKTGRDVHRLEGITRSPLVGHVCASMDGLLVIRSSHAQNNMHKIFDDCQNLHYSSSFMVISTKAAFALLADLTTFAYITSIFFYFFFISEGEGAGNVGLAITQSFMLSGMLQYGIIQSAMFESKMTSVERLLEYSSIEKESVDGENPESWPTEGKIEYKNVSLRYLTLKNNILKDVSFLVKPKEKVGIVGRTGAGKSSIISVLFKLYDIDGEILIDGKNINQIKNQLVRKSISVIPQDPILFSGTLRNNIDPENKSTDSEIWKYLEKVELKSLVSSFKTGLDTEVSEDNTNFSSGQKQLIHFVKALLERNKILVLDEATSKIDPQSDAIIQRLLNNEFKEHTILSIAHRLKFVVNCDKVMVVDSGQIVEYDDPNILLKNPESTFYKMMGRSGFIREDK